MTTVMPGTTAPSAHPLPGLGPLQESLIAAARQQAAQLVSDARTRGEAEVAHAEEWLDEQLAGARERGREDGAQLAEVEVAATRRQAHTRLLGARREVYDDLVHRSQDAVRRLLVDPSRRRGLEARLRSVLGPGAVVTDTADGGLRAEDETGASVDASVQTLVAQALDELDLEDLWTPR
ncbi:hypothetical protein ABEG17_16970 [Pedococcus sp. KACC 23699]|uniref:Uncharacterized protein n=1 Tax=Pedococcus sp. KACC 23699 TaxID=3149228 RepID=A0AAU7JS67_9MICO